MNTSGSPNNSAAISKTSPQDRAAESISSALPERTETLVDHRSAVQQVLREVDRLKAKIEKLRPLDPDVEARIMETFMLSWNYHSNAIEGNTLSLGETKTFLKHGLTAKGKPFKDYLDIEGHDEALDYSRNLSTANGL